jgi:GNAT superfamily N-acetyltransferase
MAADSPAFRLAHSGDVTAIVDLVQSAYRGEPSRAGWTTEAHLLDGQRTDATQVAAAIAQPRSRMVVALDDAGGVQGSCALEQRGDGVAYFGMFSIRPVLQGTGIGRALLAEAERMALRELACSTMEMTVITQRIELIAWYERRGYRRTGQTRPFPYGDERFGVPRRPDLAFEVLSKQLA